MAKLPRLAIIGLVLCGVCAAATEARTGHFRLITPLEPKTARAAAQHLETIRSHYLSLGLAPASSEDEPISVILLAGLGELQALDAEPDPRRGDRGGFSIKGRDRDFIVVAWETPNPRLALAHEYAHQLTAAESQPLWFREGLAEYLSHLVVTDGRIGLGLPVAGHVKQLRANRWIALADLVTAGHGSPAWAQPPFYAQSWLLVRWLAAEHGGLQQLSPDLLERVMEKQGAGWVEAQLREQLEDSPPRWVERPEPVPEAAVRLRETAAWELPFLLADLRRELQRWDQARELLHALARDQPRRPEPRESLGALAMDRGLYEEAEQHLRAAIRKGSRSARTHYRYSLMLMRPAPGAAPWRARQAVAHARLARENEPRQPLYALAQAQAHVLAQQWDDAARVLFDLLSVPEWRARAEREFEQLERRRQQQLAAVTRPPLGNQAMPPAQFAFLAPPLAPVTAPPAPPAPEPTRAAWPPAGTVLLFGRISKVECRGDVRIITVHTARSLIRLRESLSAPAELHYPPLRWKQLPCDTSGWEVNVAYRPTRRHPDVRGELVAVVF